jgi:hypothetical protein
MGDDRRGAPPQSLASRWAFAEFAPRRTLSCWSVSTCGSVSYRQVEKLLTKRGASRWITWTCTGGGSYASYGFELLLTAEGRASALGREVRDGLTDRCHLFGSRVLTCRNDCSHRPVGAVLSVWCPQTLGSFWSCSRSRGGLPRIASFNRGIPL